MKINQEIRAPKVRLINEKGQQVGIVDRSRALALAVEASLDLVEVVPTASPPVCKIIDYGKFLYDQAKREKESKKSQVQIKVKEVKLKPNIDTHDLDFKVKRAQEFLSKGNKVKLTCTFRGREMAHTDVGLKVMQRFMQEVEELCSVESHPKQMGRSMIAILAPLSVAQRKKK